MKFQSVKRIKIFIVLLSVPFVLTLFMFNPKSGLVVVQARGGAEILCGILRQMSWQRRADANG